MRPDEVRRLLGGYATGTLTDEERTLLFSAALEDQSLFDALADEEALRELLADPLVRGELLAELDPPANEARPWESPVTGSLAVSSATPAPSASMMARPVTDKASESAWASFVRVLTPRRMAIAGAFAVLIVVIGGVRYLLQSNAARPFAEKPFDVAMSKPPAVSQPEQPAAQPPQPESAARESAAPASPATSASARRGPSANEIRQAAGAGDAGNLDARKDSLPAEQPAASAGPVRPAVAPPPPRRENAPAGQIATIPATTPFSDRDKQIADQRREGEPSAANLARGGVASDEKDAERKTEIAAAPPAVPQASTVPGFPAAPSAFAEPPPPPAPAARVRPSGNQAAANQAVKEQGSERQLRGFAAGSGSLAASSQDRLKQMNARVTDLNGTIVSISVGTNAGLKSGDMVEIVRGDRVIGTVRLTRIGAAFSVGPFSGATGGPGLPRAGDLVQTPPPVKP